MINTATGRHLWRSTLGVLLTILLVAFLSPMNARAGEDPDWDASAYKGWAVSSVEIRGLTEEMASELRAGLALNLSTGFLGTKSPIFFPQTLEEDTRRVHLFLARRGYPCAAVTPSFEPDPKKQKVVVVLDINRGPGVRIGSVSVTGIPEGLEKDAQKTVSVETDSIFADGDLDQTVRSLIAFLNDESYAKAKVEPLVEWRDSTHVDVTIKAIPGAAYYFGDVIVTGADEDLEMLVKRSVTARRGNRYDGKVLDDSQNNLRVLGLFRQVRLELVDAGPDTLDVAADLVMRESRRFDTGVRYLTDEKLDVRARWTHRNLFKRGRGGSALVSASSVLQRIEFSAWWPAILVAKSRLAATISARRESEEGYELAGTGGELSLSYHFSLQSRITAGVLISDINVTEKFVGGASSVVETQDGRLLAYPFYWEWNRSNDPIVPTAGTIAILNAEWAPDGLFSDYRYWRIEPAGIAYIPVPGTSKTVFATRVTVGVAQPTGESTELLPNKRFYSGGASSMRGFARRKLGPLDAEGAPIGGEAKLEASVEFRFPIFWRIQGAAFVDAGQVWLMLRDANVNDIEVAVGPGLWLATPVGPLRTDLGYRLTNYEKSQPRWVFHFSIGPAF